MINTEDWEIALRWETKKTFNTLKRNLNETVHFVIFQAAYKKVLEINASNFVIDAYLY